MLIRDEKIITYFLSIPIVAYCMVVTKASVMEAAIISDTEHCCFSAIGELVGEIES